MGDTAIKIDNLSKMYDIGEYSDYTLRSKLGNLFKFNKKREFWALRDVSLDIKFGESIGLVGGNGAGKSTLLKILSRVTYPTIGKVTVYGRLSSLLEVGTGFHPELTGRENVYLKGSLLGMNKKEVKSKFDEIVDFSGIEKFIDVPVKHFSSGMFVRLAFSVSAHLNANVLLIDEVLSVGDVEFQNKCLNKIKEVTSKGATFILVSHNESVINKMCQKKILLHKGRVVKSISQRVLENINRKEYKGQDVIDISIAQKGKIIVVRAKYRLEVSPLIPNLGFACYDRNNTFIFSYNPMMEGEKYLSKIYPKEGNLELIIKSPRLQNGIYNFKFYFGTGGKDSFSDHEGIDIEIHDMVFYNNKESRIEGDVKFTVEKTQIP